jgi:protein-tyrosine phosphatase
MVMFVCYGNIIRSAFSEALLRAELARLGVDGIEVISTGTDARSGREADRRAIALAPEFGVSLERHRATRVTRELMERCDAVFAMDFSNQAKLTAQFPDSISKILLLAPSVDAPGPLQVPDPYTGDVEAVRACYGVLQKRILSLAAQLAAMQQRSRTYSSNASR